jgi:hypothetical protein
MPNRWVSLPLYPTNPFKVADNHQKINSRLGKGRQAVPNIRPSRWARCALPNPHKYSSFQWLESTLKGVGEEPYSPSSGMAALR